MNSEPSEPTWRNKEQLQWIRDLSQALFPGIPSRERLTDALEIGTYCGAGARALLEGVSGLVFSIEPIGYAPENEEEIEAQNADRKRWITKLAEEFPDRFIPIAGRSEHQIWHRPIDVLVIDGDHSFSGVYDSRIRFATHVTDGGIVFVDAYDHPDKPEVKPAWDIERNPACWEHLGNVRNLHAWRRHLVG